MLATLNVSFVVFKTSNDKYLLGKWKALSKYCDSLFY